MLVRTCRPLQPYRSAMSRAMTTAKAATATATIEPENHNHRTHQIVLILDFDGTLTLKDTLHLVAKAGYQRQHQRQQEHQNPTHSPSSQPRQPAQPVQPTPWSEIVNAYTTDYKAHVAAYTPTKQARTSPAQESAWLNSLRELESRSARRAYNAGIFNGVRTCDFERVAEESIRDGDMVFRDGWSEVLSRGRVTALNRGERDDSRSHQPGKGKGKGNGDEDGKTRSKESESENRGKDENGKAYSTLSPTQMRTRVQVQTQIVSVNWSASFILAALSHDAVKADPSLSSTSWTDIHDKLGRVIIHANEYPLIHDDHKTELETLLTLTSAHHEHQEIRTSGDKKKIMDGLRRRLHGGDGDEDGNEREREREHERGHGRGSIVYVGDSTTDFECLVDADVGICIRDEPMSSGQQDLAETCERLGIRVSRLGENVLMKETARRQQQQQQFWWARDFHEIDKCLGQLVSLVQEGGTG